MAGDVYIGIDIGGTRIRAARLDENLEIQARTESPSHAAEGTEAVIDIIFKQAATVMPTDGTRVAGIGISAAGPINPKAGLVVKLTNFAEWRNIPLRDRVVEKFGIETYIGNDANVAALAEGTLGAGRGYSDMLFFTISTGIGTGVITAGKMLVGSEGLGAECGHVIMVVDGDRVSTLEKEAAGPAIARQARAAIEGGERSNITTLVNGRLDAISAKHVSQAAKDGDALGMRLIQHAARMVGLGIVSHLHIFNPQIVVLGGGVIEGTWDMFQEPMMDAIRTYSMEPEYWNNLVITRAALGENVSLIGAGALAKQKGAS